jgi:hypothetical protein
MEITMMKITRIMKIIVRKKIMKIHKTKKNKIQIIQNMTQMILIRFKKMKQKHWEVRIQI